MSRNAVATQDIIEGLRKMGLRAGDGVMVHSSLSSMGYVEGGPDTVVEAFLSVLGPEGTLMVPTFTHSGTEYFDPLSSPSKNGAITEAVRRHSRAIRSLHPTHAVTVIGPEATNLVCDDLQRGPLGVDCALDRLAQRGGWILLLGVDHQTNSTIHLGEAYAGDPDRHSKWSPGNPKQVILNHPDHGEMEVLITSMMGSTVAFERMENALRERDQIIDGRIGNATCQLMRGQHVIDAAVDILRPIFGNNT
ncbi:MAG: AAC(3) family N-acetyltransferase [Candidatus Poribacteria bacterium]|nr:AAC(3) family N-acetyltransferase [Candidatus Poribacteria bacterium]